MDNNKGDRDKQRQQTHTDNNADNQNRRRDNTAYTGAKYMTTLTTRTTLAK